MPEERKDFRNFSNIREGDSSLRSLGRGIINRFSGPYPGDRGVNMVRRRAIAQRDQKRSAPRNGSR
jgi:hypothetical protein